MSVFRADSPNARGNRLWLGVALFGVLGVLVLLRRPPRAEQSLTDGAHPAPEQAGVLGESSDDGVGPAPAGSTESVGAKSEDQRVVVEPPPNRTRDDEYRLGRLTALKAAVEEVQGPARSSYDRVNQVALLATASVATILDAQGLYRENPQGQFTKVVRLEGHERISFNGRYYDVPLGEFPELEHARALRRQLSPDSEAPRPLQSVEEVRAPDELVQQVVSRAKQAIQIVESDLEAKRIKFN